MRNRGFTLIELLGVVAILSMLGLIIIPAINGILNDKKNDLYNVQIRNIESAANSYVSEHVFEIDIDVDTSKGITLGTLKNLGYISDIKNPLTRESFSNDLVIIITNTNKGFEFKVCTTDVSCDIVDML